MQTVPNEKRLLEFGFSKQKDGYIYTTSILNQQFQMTVKITDAVIQTQLLDKETGEEYVLHKTSAATGAFVGAVREAHDSVLSEIKARCFESEIFQKKYVQDILDYVFQKYGDELEFLWEKFPKNGVLRRKDSQKWYAVFTSVSKEKFGAKGTDPAEILILHGNPAEISYFIDFKSYFPAYHMNKKNWFTICLDGSVPLSAVFKHIDISYKLAKKK